MLGSVRIAPELLAEIVAHAEREAPNECCGIVGLHDGEARSVHPFENTAASPFRFEIDGLALSRLLDDLEDDGQWYAIYHSHTRSDPYPSQTDVNFARNWPGVEWLIVGVASEEPVVRTYTIDDGAITEVALD